MGVASDLARKAGRVPESRRGNRHVERVHQHGKVRATDTGAEGRQRSMFTHGSLRVIIGSDVSFVRTTVAPPARLTTWRPAYHS